MSTVRSLINRIADYIDFDTTHYIASSIVLPLEGNNEYHFSTKNDHDVRNEIYIALGDTLSKFKKGHIHIVHCTLPREFVTSDIEKYRDLRDPAMYKFWLPERIFNSILQGHPIDISKMISRACLHYMDCGYEWDSREIYDKKIRQMEGWDKYFYPAS